MSSGVLLFLTTFVASAVEAVEALTIVLAVGVVRGWRSTLLGVGAAALALAAVVVALGSSLSDPHRHAPARGRGAAAGVRPAVAAQGVALVSLALTRVLRGRAAALTPAAAAHA